MNEFADFITMILGSPWLAFLVAVWLLLSKEKQHIEMIKAINEQNSEMIKAINEQHKEEMKGVSRTLEKLNTSIRELLEEWRKV